MYFLKNHNPMPKKGASHHNRPKTRQINNRPLADAGLYRYRNIPQQLITHNKAIAAFCSFRPFSLMWNEISKLNRGQETELRLATLLNRGHIIERIKPLIKKMMSYAAYFLSHSTKVLWLWYSKWQYILPTDPGY